MNTARIFLVCFAVLFCFQIPTQVNAGNTYGVATCSLQQTALNVCSRVTLAPTVMQCLQSNGIGGLVNLNVSAFVQVLGSNVLSTNLYANPNVNAFSRIIYCINTFQPLLAFNAGFGK